MVIFILGPSLNNPRSGHSCGIITWDDPLTGDEIRFAVVTAGVNYTNILPEAFLCENYLCSFYVLIVRVSYFRNKEISKIFSYNFDAIDFKCPTFNGQLLHRYFF